MEETPLIENLEQLRVLSLNLQDSVATANFSSLPKLKLLRLTTSNLTTKFSIPPNGVIANLEFLSLSNSNPLLDYDTLPYQNFKNLSILYLFGSKIAKLPSTLVELDVELKENEKPILAEFQHFKNLETVDNDSEVECNCLLHNQLLSSVGECSYS